MKYRPTPTAADRDDLELVAPSDARPARRSIGVLAVVLAATLVVLAGFTSLVATPAASAATLPLAQIDKTAVTRVIPADAVVNVRSYGAKGDGVADDTAAIQTAISNNLGYGKSKKVLYFGAGTYRITRPLVWKDPNGVWSTWLTLQGVDRDRTIIKLDNGAAGFGDPANPQPAIMTGSQNPYGPDGSGNEAGNNFIFDLTVNVGQGNPGATGVDFMSSNRGAIRNVVITAPAGSGATGIAMNRKYPGPTLIDNVRVSGFNTGISVDQSQYGVTLTSVRLSSQRSAGVFTTHNAVTARDLKSTNTVPAVVSGNAAGSRAFLTLIDSSLTSPGSTEPAISSMGSVFMRGTTASGYSTLIRSRGQNVTVAPGAEWTSDAPIKSGASSSTSLNMPVVERPAIVQQPATAWAGVTRFGAIADDYKDDTAGIQAALDSGLPVVYFPSGRYRISQTLRIPPTVQRIEGFDAMITTAGGAFPAGSTAAVFSSIGASATPLHINQVYFQTAPEVVNVERTGTRPLNLVDLHIGGTPLRATAGQIWVTDVDGSKPWTFSAGQTVWATQLNAEPDGPKVTNNGANLWMLGFKTERPSAALQMQGGRTEILGGLLYAVTPPPAGDSAFVVNGGGVLSASIAIQADSPSNMYPLIARSPAGTVVPTQAVLRGAGRSVPLLRVG